jgi:hypothetical protein
MLEATCYEESEKRSVGKSSNAPTAALIIIDPLETVGDVEDLLVGVL